MSSRLVSRALGWSVFALAGILLFGVWGCWFVSNVSAAVAQVRASRWHATDGIVTKSRIVGGGGTPFDERTVWFEVDVRYRYVVDGRTYFGRRYRFPDGQWRREPYVRTAVEKLPVGAVVPVYYSPGNPERSLLRPGLEGADLVKIYISFVPFGFLLGGGAAALGAWRDRRRFPSADGDGMYETSDVMSVDGRALSPWAGSFLLALFAGGLAHVPLLIIGDHFAPVPLWGAALAWIAAPGTFLVALLSARRARRLASERVVRRA